MPFSHFPFANAIPAWSQLAARTAPSRSPILRCVSVGSRWLACPAPNPICICPTDGQLLPVFRIYPGASLMLEARSRAAV
jgi:hypothetical protein